MRRLIFPLILGLGGAAILVALGFWQLQRLDWKQGQIAAIEARIAAPPLPLPEAPTEATDEYRPVRLTGRPTGQELHVLVSGTAAGTGYRVISRVETAAGRRIMVDQGLLPLEAKAAPPATAMAEMTGTLLWPDDRTSSTPEPDRAANIWFARDVAAMAEALGTEPLLVVLGRAEPADPRLTPLPVSGANIRNEHLGYAITWFGLALAWLGMTALLIRRITRRQV